MVTDKKLRARALTLIGKCKAMDFFSKIFEFSYSKENMIEMFAHGYLTGKENVDKYKKDIKTLTERLKHSDETKDTQSFDIKVMKNNNADLAKTVKELEQKIKNMTSTNAKKMSSELELCTNKFMKIIDKKDKEILKLKNAHVVKAKKPKNIKNGLPKLDCLEVKAIRKKFKTIPCKEELDAIASKYNISAGTVRRIIKKETYKKCL